jgi:hypothetical protein
MPMVFGTSIAARWHSKSTPSAMSSLLQNTPSSDGTLARASRNSSRPSGTLDSSGVVVIRRGSNSPAFSIAAR